jgi:hypothetical protein
MNIAVVWDVTPFSPVAYIAYIFMVERKAKTSNDQKAIINWLTAPLVFIRLESAFVQKPVSACGNLIPACPLKTELKLFRDLIAVFLSISYRTCDYNTWAISSGTSVLTPGLIPGCSRFLSFPQLPDRLRRPSSQVCSCWTCSHALHLAYGRCSSSDFPGHAVA